jgi:outer membrane murein-binding lipoprotein Lpp
MSLAKKLLALAAAPAVLALSGCATGLPAQVTRFQQMPAPQGQTFAIQAADPDDRGGLEFSRYADLVRRHLIEQGYSEASSPQAATLLVSLDYGVDEGKQQIVRRPGFGPRYGGFGYGGFGYGYRPYWSRFGYYGRYRSPFYYGWDDPFWYSPWGDEIDAFTVYTSFVDMDIRRPDGQAVFEGTAKARSRTDNLQVLVPNLVEALFTGFPGNSGETVKITVAPDRDQRR